MPSELTERVKAVMHAQGAMPADFMTAVPALSITESMRLFQGDIGQMTSEQVDQLARFVGLEAAEVMRMIPKNCRPVAGRRPTGRRYSVPAPASSSTANAAEQGRSEEPGSTAPPAPTPPAHQPPPASRKKKRSTAPAAPLADEPAASTAAAQPSICTLGIYGQALHVESLDQLRDLLAAPPMVELSLLGQTKQIDDPAALRRLVAGLQSLLG